MQEAFRNRIKHYHLSGADKEMKNGSHHCLLQDRRQAELVGAMRLSNPIIIESVFPENKKPDELVDIMKREMEYIETKI
jgi:hypothetical protein